MNAAHMIKVFVSRTIVFFNPLITIVPKGIFPQSYDNCAFRHGFQCIPILYKEACLVIKLHSLKLRSLNG